jgi:hypothetical protein
MTRRLSLPLPDKRTVFINIPYEPSYEGLFVAIISSLVSLGYTPHCTLEIAETGQGRLNRIQEVLSSCETSVHFLCRVGTPVRFNMPFELGLAWSLAYYTQRHNVILFERKRHRLAKTLSDIQGYDPLIHKGSMKGIIECVLDAFASNNDDPEPIKVRSYSRELWRYACDLKRREGRDDLFNRTLFRTLITGSVNLAVDRGFIQH